MPDAQTSMATFRASLTAARLHEALIRVDALGPFSAGAATFHAAAADKAFDELVELMAVYRAARLAVAQAEAA